MDSSTETLTENGSNTLPVVQLTAEQLAYQEQSLKDGIELGVKWFAEAQDAEAYALMSEKEQTFSRLLDPLVWVMREALVTFEHEDCEDCRVRREADGNSLGVSVAEMLLGRM